MKRVERTAVSRNCRLYCFNAEFEALSGKVNWPIPTFDRVLDPYSVWKLSVLFGVTAYWPRMSKFSRRLGCVTEELNGPVPVNALMIVVLNESLRWANIVIVSLSCTRGPLTFP